MAGLRQIQKAPLLWPCPGYNSPPSLSSSAASWARRRGGLLKEEISSERERKVIKSPFPKKSPATKKSTNFKKKLHPATYEDDDDMTNPFLLSALFFVIVPEPL
jgi:hypothetical protein